MSSIKISIPTPCHENWAGMSPTEKGRFCGSCQKQVVDFTKASDRQIAQAYKTEKHLCGRFLATQLNRELVVPDKKTGAWGVASAAVISFFALSSQKAVAQGEPVKVETAPAITGDTIVVAKNSGGATRIISGIVTAVDDGFALPGANVINLTTKDTSTTDIEGRYSIKVSVNDTIAFRFIGMKDFNLVAGNDNVYNVALETNAEQLEEYVVTVGYVSRPSFFRRAWYRITRVFR